MNTYSSEEQQILLKIADSAIKAGLQLKKLQVVPAEYSIKLQEIAACFVTLQQQRQLRGCMGSLRGYRPLVLDVANNAFAAAFNDPRFPRLTAIDYQQVQLHISILSQPQRMHFSSEQDLLQQLRPGVDGLILTAGQHIGTFLPTVWTQLPTAELFLMQLKIKAGLPPDYWSNDLVIERYTTESISS